MAETPKDSKLTSPLIVEVVGASEGSCQEAVDAALDLLAKKLPAEIKQLVSGAEITIGNDLIQGGGLTKAEDKEIILDADKNALSLQTAENYLAEADYLAPGDWTKALPSTKDQEWSCLTYQLVHEFGHLVDGLSEGSIYKRLPVALSPTKYGSTSQVEAFAEAFAYWVFELDLAPEAQKVVLSTLNV